MSLDDNDLLQAKGIEALDPEEGLAEATADLVTADHDLAITELQRSKVDHCYDEAVGRMFDRAEGREVLVPRPWDSVDAALGGGLWAGQQLGFGVARIGGEQATRFSRRRGRSPTCPK